MDCTRTQEDIQRRTEAAYRRDWLEAHGYLPRMEMPPLPPSHWCPTQYGYLVHGSRADCPHCKLPAPGRDGDA